MWPFREHSSWEAALPLDDLTLFYGTEVVGEGGAEAGQGREARAMGSHETRIDGSGEDLGNIHQTRVLLPEVPIILMPQTSSS